MSSATPSTHVSATLPSAPPSPRPGGRPSFARLTAVELRKTVDTTSGRWMLAVFIALSLLALIVSLHRDAASISIADDAWYQPLTVLRQLIPVLGILALTSEWTRRTALTTFTLTPQRWRVLAAKLVAALVLTIAAVAVVAALGAGVAEIVGLVNGIPVRADHALHVLGTAILGAELQTLLGAALSALLQQTAVALVTFFVAPALVEVAALHTLGDGSRWISIVEAIDDVATLHPVGGAATFTAVGLWILLPLAAGTVRTLVRQVD